MTGTWIEAIFTCSFCTHETKLIIATQSTVEGQTLSCPVCGSEMGQLNDPVTTPNPPCEPEAPETEH